MVGPQDRCMALGCEGPAEHGAHVWLEGERRFFYVALFCRNCNHRHGGEEICFCRYIGLREEPAAWIPIRDTWLYKHGTAPGAPPEHNALRPFDEWCRTNGPPAHGRRDRCCLFCPGGRAPGGGL